ncbi:MAG: serine/threonine-protein kinase PknK, partial [Chloroflexi bacterium]|nr:serine/threonine-protein kinase PknK [Chloroflexota bacterium]
MEHGKLITNRYRIINKLGQGGMGVVWRVYDRLEHREVALKQVLIPDKDLDFASKVRTDDTDKLRLSLAHEFSILATLRHPHILSVLDFGFDEDKHPFYTMTLLEGGTDCKTYGINLSRERRIVLMGQMLQAMHYLHRRGVLHRDLKPDNVFVTKDEQVKVMDFGLAKQDKAQSTKKDTISGTINYMAPELFQGKKASVASDLFAIGVMVYEIMVGQHPFAADNVGQIINKITTHIPDFSAIPDDFVPWLQTILEKDPADRFATAYDAMIAFYDAVGVNRPAESQTIRESFLQASTFVGRSNQLDTLRQALDEAQNGHGSVWLIGGESGVGKSRLMEELRIYAMVAGALVLRGSAVEEGGLPLQIWRGVARGLAISVDGITDNEAGVLKQIVPDIDDFLGYPVHVAPPLIGGAAMLRLRQTMMQLVERHTQTVVLLLDDLQWVSDFESWLERIAELVPKQRLLMIGSYRSDEHPHFAEGIKAVQRMPLPRLQREDIRRLSE